MNLTLPAALLVLSTPGLFAGEMRSTMRQMPDRPGIPVAYVDGQRLVVVAFKGTNPVVVSKGARTTLHDAHVTIIPGEGFAPGVVTIDKAEAVSMTRTTTFDFEASRQQYTTFDGKVTADRDMSDVYLILLVFEDLNGDYSGAPKVAILGTSLGSLAAGVKKQVGVNFPPLTSKMQLHWAALIYSGGMQVHSSGDSDGLLSALFETVDQVGLQKAISDRRYGDHPLMVFRRFPLKFDADLKQRYAGKTMNMTALIAASGRLDYIQADSAEDEELAREVASQVGTWLFVPRIVNGGPLESSVVIPIKF